MNEWTNVKLANIIDITSSKRIFYSEYVESGVPFYRSKEIINLFNKNDIQTELFISEERFLEIKEKFGVPEEGDILLTSVGTLGIPYIVRKTDKFYFKDGNLTWFKKQKVNSSILSKYLFYWLISPVGKQSLDEISIGSTQAALTITGLKSLEISLPPLPEQKAIADVLSALDDKIDLLQCQNETLEKMAETLFRQWFIEEAKEDWELCSFEKWVSGTKGGDWGKEVPVDDFTKAVYCLRGTDIASLQNNMSVNAPLRFIKEKKFFSIEPDNGDIVIEISGGTETQSTGRSYYINEGVRKLFTQPIIFSNFCRLITVRNSKYSYFIYLYLKFLYDTDEFFALENGSSGIKNLNYKAVLFEQKFLMPAVEKVLDFHELVCSHFIKIDENRIQIQTLQNLRDTLLPKLMSGEVRVKLD